MPSNNTVGGVSVKVRLDDRDALKQLDGLRAKINALDAKLNEKRQQRSAIAEQMDEASARADAARQRVQQLQEALEKAAEKQREAQEGVEITRDLIREQEQIISSGNIKLANGDLSAAEWTQTQEAIGIAEAKLKEYNLDLKSGEALLKSSTAAVKEQERQVSRETSEYQKIVNEVEALHKKLSAADQEIAAGEQDLAKMQEQAAGLEQQVAAGESAMAKLERASGAAAQRMSKSFERLGRMIRRVFVFTVILGALRQLREYLNSVLMSTPEFSEAFAQLRGALLTLVQPIMELVIPILTRLVQIITQVVTAIASLVSSIFGKSLQASKESAAALYDQASAYKAAGGAAKKASRQLAAFDQLNVLQDQSSGGSAGGGSGAAAPSFDFEELEPDKFNELLDIIAAIGAALLAWKISDLFGLGLQQGIGLALALYGTFQLVKGFLDAWNNGVNMDNLLDMIAGLTLVAAGLGLAFGKTAAAIALIVGGLALLVLGIKDVIDNGMNLGNTLTMVAGLLAAGLGISILTGSLIPALIAGIAGLILIFVELSGQGELFTEGIRELFEGLIQFFTGVFTGDLESVAEGWNKIVSGAGKIWEAVVAGVQWAWEQFVGWLKNNASPEIFAILESIGIMFGDLWQDVEDIFNGFIEFFVGVFTGDWDKAWEGLKDIAKGVLNLIIDLFEGFLNIGYSLVNLLLSAINEIDFTIPDWVPLVGGKRFSPNIPINENMKVKLPRLATGAVIPPNREFMAVLGDQKHGTNVEAPLDTMVQAFNAANGGTVEAIYQIGNLIIAAIQNQELAAYLDGKKVSQQLYSQMQAVARTRGPALVKG